jgi:LysM repeat protein
MVEQSYRDQLVATYSETYTVQDGDTLNKIAMVHGVSSKDLAYANKCSPDFIFPGKVSHFLTLNSLSGSECTPKEQRSSQSSRPRLFDQQAKPDKHVPNLAK